MVARLYAMFQASQKMLVFLIAVLLISIINNVATAGVEWNRMTAGKLELRMWDSSTSPTITSGGHPLWHSSVRLQLWRRNYFDRRQLGSYHSMGGHRAVSLSLDYCKTLSSTAQRMVHRRLLRNINKISLVLFCSVSSWFHRIFLSAELLHQLCCCFLLEPRHSQSKDRRTSIRDWHIHPTAFSSLFA